MSVVRSRRGWIAPAVILLLAVGGNAAVFFAATYPRHRQLTAALAAHDSAEGDLHATRQQLRSLQVLGGDALRAAEDLDVLLERRLDPTSRLPEALAFLRASAADSGVSLESIDYSVEPVEQLGAVSLGMSIRGAGSYAAIRRWVEALREGPGVMFVDSVEIASSGGTVLSVELTAVAMLRAAEGAQP